MTWKEMYKNFVNGQKWIEDRKAAGFDTKKDEQDFLIKIVEPMLEMEAGMSDGQKQEIMKIKAFIDAFPGSRLL